MNLINEILQEQQSKTSLNWTGFADIPTTREEAEEAINNIPKKFHY